ncbi:hypothetical protein [Bradyrhizobium zhanjiangense]|nr:hypothetical protein [Bradyrhizobium zhanjiangense]
MIERNESRARVASAIQAVADWVDDNISSFTWDISKLPTEEETEARKQEIRQANDTLRTLARDGRSIRKSSNTE